MQKDIKTLTGFYALFLGNSNKTDKIYQE